MLLEKDKSCLLLIDVQEKLTPLVMQSNATTDRCEWLIKLAKELNVPIVVSEQYPNGLGHTVASLKQLTFPDKAVEKVHFSCWREPSFKNQLKGLNKKQVVLIGIETHVCVLQTALDLLHADFDVFVVVDAVSSRHELDYQYGLKRMKQEGVSLVSSEMVFFEWVEKAGTPAFKALSKQFLQ